MSENIDINVGIIKEEISINAANNIVEVNISTAPVIIINPQDYDLSQFTNTSPNPFVQQSSLASYVPISRNITINGVTQNLTTDRSWTISTGITIGTTAITSGTVGRVLFEGTGNVVQESANLFWDETNGRLGIGTSSPAHKLTVNADNNSTAVGIDFPSAHFDFSANSTSNYTASFHINNVGMDIGHDSTSRSLNLQTGNLDRVTILGNGNVGINTTTDAGYRLDVNGTARVQGALTLASTVPSISITGDLTIRNATTTWFTLFQATGNLLLQNGGTFTDAGYRLDVNGPTRILGFLRLTNTVEQSGGYSNTLGTLNYYLNSVIISPTSGTAVFNGFIFAPTINQTGGANGITRGIYINPTLTSAFDFRAIETTAGNVIFNGGNVGIGTTSPGAKLEVADSIPVLRITGTRDASWTIGQTMASLEYFSEDASGSAANSVRASINLVNETSVFGSTTGLSFSTKGDVVGSPIEAMRINSSGNVGIGTANPAEKLHVYGGVSAIKIDSTTNEASLKYDNSTTTAAIKLANNDLKTELGGSERMRILANGNLLINTTTDAGFKLDVSGSTRFRTGADAAFEYNSGIIYHGGNYFQLYSGLNYLLQARAGYGLAFGSNNTERMRINSSGIFMVGGTTGGYAGTKIHVGNFTDSQNGINILTSTTGYGHILFGDGTAADTYRGQITYYHGDDSMSFNASGGQKMRISSAGAIQFNSYDSTNQTGTPTYLLGTDASGNVVKTNTVPGSAAGPYLPLAGGTMSGNLELAANTLNFADNGKARFGNSTDLQIYHDGSNSYINESGTGDLYVQTNGNNMFLRDSASGNVFIAMNTGSANVSLRQGGNTKLTTTSTGVSVTGNVLINTPTDAGYKLDVNGTARMGTLRLLNTLDTLEFANTLVRIRRAANGMYLDAFNGFTFFDSTSSVDRVRITQDGNVGIGTTSPSATLDINSQRGTATNLSSSKTAAGFDLNSNTSGGTNSLTIGETDQTSYFLQHANSAGTTAYNLALNPYGGNVGIGTASPVAAFQVGSITATATSQVVGKARIVGTNYIPSATQMGTLDIASTTRNSSAPFNQGFGPSLTFSQNISGYVDGYEVVLGAIKTISTQSGNTGQEAAMTFLINGGTSTGIVERMRIDSSGNVGIGTSSPTANLHIVTGSKSLRYTGNLGDNFDGIELIGSNPTLKLDGGGNTFNIAALSLGLGIYDTTSSGYRLTIFNNGNIAIGTTTDAGFKLDVNGTARVSGDMTIATASGATLTLQSNNSNIVWTGGAFGIYFNTTRLVRFGNDGTIRFAQNIIVAGTTIVAIDSSAILQANSTTQGFLPPRMTTTQKNAIASPAAGLVVYDTDLNALCTYNGTTWITLGSGGSASSSSGIHVLTEPITGFYYSQITITGTSVLGGGAFQQNGSLQLFPFVPANTLTCDLMQFEIVTAAASALSKIAIYSDVAGKPSAKLYESPDTDSSTTGYKTVTTSFTFTGGTTYWIGLVSNSNSIQPRAIPSANFQPLVYQNGTNQSYNGWYISAAYGSLPATTTVTSTNVNMSSVPYISFRQA